MQNFSVLTAVGAAIVAREEDKESRSSSRRSRGELDIDEQAGMAAPKCFR
jgi:hypothetical protein